MGIFVNPDNSAFHTALNSKIYVDKTGMIEYTNQVMDTEQAKKVYTGAGGLYRGYSAGWNQLRSEKQKA